MKKQTGIWLDLRDAWVITLPVEQDGEVVVEHVPSHIEESTPLGGSRSKTPWGPQGFSNQRSIEERRHLEEKRFFNKILEHIDPSTEELVVFGPSEGKYGLENLLEAQHHTPKIMGVVTADKMTQHQMTAWVRVFYDRSAPRRLSKFDQEHEK